jgi:hypothetical protein
MNLFFHQNCLCHHGNFPKIHRRQLLKILMGSSLGLSSWLQLSSAVYGSSKVKALVLSCIDFRFVTKEQNFLKTLNLEGKYDWLSLAGASLALNNFPSIADTQTFWEQLQLSIHLHQIEEVIILDHQDCGAYATKIDRQLSQNSLQEKEIHRLYLTQAAQAIKQKYPFLQVQLYFAHLNGDIEKISST